MMIVEKERSEWWMKDEECGGERGVKVGIDIVSLINKTDNL